MTTKTTLLAATALAALAFAGAANAGQITGSTINAQNLTGGTNNALTPYTIASETTDPTSGAPLNSAATGLVLRNTLTNVLTTAASANNTYTVEFALTGPAQFTNLSNTSLVAFDNQAVPVAIVANITFQNISPNATVARYLVTVTAPAGNAINISRFELTGGLSVTGEADVSVSGGVNQAVAGGGSVAVDTVASSRILRFSTALAGYTAATARNVLAALPDFKLFASAASNTAGVSNPVTGGNRTVTVTAAYSNALNSATGNAGSNFYAGLSGTALAATDIISSAAATVTGTNLDKLSPTLGAASPSPAATATSASFALTGAAAVSGNFVLTTSATAGDRPVLQTGNYALNIVPSYASGFSGPASASLSSILNVQNAGTNFIAPWFSGSQAQSQSQVRISNTGATAATARVTITNGVFNFNGAPTSFAETVCPTTFTVPVDGDLVLTNAVINTCFGAFLRGDLLITVEADNAAITAKMRNTSTNGTFETTLGRYSGSAIAGAQ